MYSYPFAPTAAAEWIQSHFVIIQIKNRRAEQKNRNENERETEPIYGALDLKISHFL